MPAALSQISQQVKQAALAADFQLSGIASLAAGGFPELERFPEWIERGHAGEMEYMQARDEQGRLKRVSLHRVLPWARSVVVCAQDYDAAAPFSTECCDPERGWIARYAWTREDYHLSVMRRLRAVEARLRELAGEEIRTRCWVDTGPVVERVYARHAGVGWIGKNTCLLNQQRGSWLFLGVIVTSLDLAPDTPAADRCGNCTRCLDACPTGALIAPYQLDSRLCISYLTIEKRGEIDEDLRAGMGRQVFGCDICQDVCPWNRKARRTSPAAAPERPELVNPALEWLAALTADDFQRLFRGSPVHRTKLNGLRRNVAIAMGNSGRREFIPQLEALARDPDPVVAEHARWGLERLAQSTVDP